MSAREPEGRPLYVDLDGTLVSTDTLWESLWLCLRRHPLKLGALLLRLSRGRARFKSYLARLVVPDPELLPYRRSVLDLIDRARDEGRRVVLATASDERVAEAVADHLEVFDAVIASHDGRNLKSAAKLGAIRSDAGGADFEYAGNSSADLAIWFASARAYQAGGSERLRRRLEQRQVDVESCDDVGGQSGLAALRKALRPHQWAKNVLLFAPLVLAQQVLDLKRLAATLAAFVTFCAIASAGYLVNDMLDIEGDRRHATKRRRPLAAGTLSIPAALIAVVLLMAGGMIGAVTCVSVSFGGMLFLYLVLTLSYSLVLKEKLFLDVLILAGLYTHRVLAGGVAANVDVSPWLLVFSVFFFMSLAMLKRYTELLQTREAGLAENDRIGRRAYSGTDVDLVETMGISSGYVSVLVLGLYTSRSEVTQLYSYPDALWLILPLMLYWISRVWFLARRGEMSDDPVSFAMRDRNSYFVVAGIVVVGAAAAFVGGA